MKKLYTVTKDVSASLKKLRKLERKGLIRIVQVKIENVSRRVTNQPLPNCVFGHTKWDESKFSSEDDVERFEQLKRIIGKANIKDAIHVDTHIRDENDYFVTEDTDILNVKTQLEQQFHGLKIFTPDELETELSKV